jgi:hypothetical protein
MNQADVANGRVWNAVDHDATAPSDRTQSQKNGFEHAAKH